jgi:hypothetical protein
VFGERFERRAIREFVSRDHDPLRSPANGTTTLIIDYGRGGANDLRDLAEMSVEFLDITPRRCRVQHRHELLVGRADVRPDDGEL